MTIRDSSSNNQGNPGAVYLNASAPTEDELVLAASESSSGEPEVIIQAQPVYPGAYNGDDVPFVQATSVVTEHSPYSSSYNNNNLNVSVTPTISTSSGPIALATGPARLSTSFNGATEPTRPPSSAMSPGVSVVTGPQGTNSIQQVHPTAQYNSRYRNSNGALTCCAISMLVTIGVCCCCFLPLIIFVISWIATGMGINWDDFDDDHSQNSNENYGYTISGGN